MKLETLSPFVIWLTLIGLTLASTLLAERHLSPSSIAIIVFAFAGLKAHMILMQFMEARQAAPHWRLLYQIWIGGISAILIAGHLVAG